MGLGQKLRSKLVIVLCKARFVLRPQPIAPVIETDLSLAVKKKTDLSLSIFCTQSKNFPKAINPVCNLKKILTVKSTCAKQALSVKQEFVNLNSSKDYAKHPGQGALAL